MIEKLKNCPNCGGTLQDDGRCRFCGSKVYDLCDIDLDNHLQTGAVKYLRIKSNDQIIICPVKIDTFSIKMNSADSFAECQLDFYIIGETICEKGGAE